MSETLAEPEPPTKECRWCGHQIPASARICRECKSYQSSWRNLALYVSSIAGAIAIAISAVTFVAANWDRAFNRLFVSNHVSMLYLNILPGHDRRMAVVNNDDSTTFVSSVTVSWRGGSEDFPFERTLQPQEFGVVNDREDASWHFDGFLATRGGKLPDAALHATVNNARQEGGCFVTNFFNSTADDLERMNATFKALGGQIVTDPAEGRINFFSSRGSTPQSQAFPVVAVFLRRDNPECTKLLR